MTTLEATRNHEPTVLLGRFGCDDFKVVDCDDENDLPDWYDHEEADLEARELYSRATM